AIRRPLGRAALPPAEQEARCGFGAVDRSSPNLVVLNKCYAVSMRGHDWPITFSEELGCAAREWNGPDLHLGLNGARGRIGLQVPCSGPVGVVIPASYVDQIIPVV